MAEQESQMLLKDEILAEQETNRGRKWQAKKT
jgi:hypothetical protein